MAATDDAVPRAGEPRLTADHARRLERDGYVIVERFLTDAELSAAVAAAWELVPSCETYVEPSNGMAVGDEPWP